MKTVWQATMGSERNRCAYAGDIRLECLFFGSESLRRGVARGEFVADGDFAFIRDAREVHWRACEVALGIRREAKDGIGRNRSGFVVVLAPVEASERNAEYEKENDDEGDAFHRSWR